MDKNINKDEIEIKNENYYDVDFDDYESEDEDGDDGEGGNWSCDDDCDNWFEDDFDDIDWYAEPDLDENGEDTVHSSLSPEEMESKVRELYKNIPESETVTDVMKNDKGFVRIITKDLETEDEFNYDLEPGETEEIIKSLF